MFQTPFWIVGSLSFGIILSRFSNLDFPPLLFLHLFSFFLALTSFFLTEKEKSFWIFYLLAIFCLGGALTRQSLQTQEVVPESNYLIVGKVNSYPIHTKSSFGERIHLKLACEYGVKGEEGWRAIPQIWSVSIPVGAGKIHYGDQLVLEGEVTHWESPRNLGSFNFVSHYQREGVSARFLVKKRWDIFLLEKNKGNFILSWIGKLHEHWSQLITRHIPLETRGIAQAFLLGEDKNISQEVRDLFSKSGTAHLLAISGGQVALIAWLVVILLRFVRFQRKTSYFLTIFILIFYCILTGRDAPILRATVMVCLYLFGSILKRESNLNYSLCWAAFFILLARPLEIFDLGFQLSFVSVFALGLWNLNRDRSGEEKPSILLTLKKSFSLSLSAWLSTLPIIAHTFFLVSPVTTFANLLAVPFFSLVVACGYAFLFLGSISPVLGDLLGGAVWFLVKVFIKISEEFSKFPFAYFHVRPPHLWEWFAFYGLFLLYFYRDRFKLSLRRYSILFLFIFNLFIWQEVFLKPNSELKITFLDVGHGDAAVIEFPNKGTLLVDAGLGGDWDQGRVTVAPFLWSKGITHLDGVLVTHPHFDHYGGIKYILKEFKVGKVFDNGDRTFPLYEGIFSGNKVKREALNLGDRLDGAPNIKIQVFHPYPKFLDSHYDPNDQSIVFKLQYGDFSLLMCGDAEQRALDSIHNIGSTLKSQVLKIPHHGSYVGKEGETFFSLVAPKVGIISEARRNRYHLPSPHTVDSLKNKKVQLFQTGIDGAIECTSDGQSFHVRRGIY